MKLYANFKKKQNKCRFISWMHDFCSDIKFGTKEKKEIAEKDADLGIK